MFKHDDIWRGVDNLAERQGITISALAKSAGLDATTFNLSKRHAKSGKQRWPTTESIAKILAATDTSIGDFLGMMQSGLHTGLAQRVPILDIHESEISNRFDNHGQPLGSIWRHHDVPSLNMPGCYGLSLDTDTYAPIYRQGDILIISPTASLRRGDRVVARTLDGQMIIRNLVRQTAHRIDLEVLDQRRKEIIMATEIEWMSRVVMVQH